MKAYILKFSHNSDVDDFTKNGSVWRTDIIDLYTNTQYKNYSARRSTYGTDLLGNGVYTGLNHISATESEIGEVDSGRFVDKSGRIDIINWHMGATRSTGTGSESVIGTLNVYHSAFSDADVTEASEWANATNITLGSDVYLIGANRYAYFEIDFSDTDVAIDVEDFDITLLVSIEIMPPVVNGYFPSTKDLMYTFPEWMDIREMIDASDATPATPNTLGGSLLNAMAGEWLSEIRELSRTLQTERFIDSVDLDQKAWVYRTSAVPNWVHSITGDGVELTRASNVHEFYRAEEADEICFWNRSSNEVYTLKEYTTLQINGITRDQELYQVWNSVDDIGASVDLFRHTNESNDSFQKRVLDVYKNHPDVSLDGFKLALRRELNMWQYEGATPDSEYAGATPTVYEMEDLEGQSDYFTSDGMPTEKFKELIDRLARDYPITWGFFKFGQAYWDPDGVKRAGFDYLPKQLDATPSRIGDQDSGVGDGNDLFVFRPDIITGEIDFSTTLKIRGRQRTERDEYLPLSFDVDIYGQADHTVYENEEFEGKFVIEITTNEATPRTLFSNITVKTAADTSASSATPTEEGVAVLDWATEDGYTDIEYIFYDTSTGEAYTSDDSATPSYQLPLDIIDSITINDGHWNPDESTYSDEPTQTDYRLWFLDTPGSVMGDGGSTSLTYSSFDSATDSTIIIVESQLYSSSVVADGYTTTKQRFSITLNNTYPNTTTKDFEIDIPEFVWPDNSSNQEIIVELATFSGDTAGAYADFNAATPSFLDYSYIEVEGSSSWTDGLWQTFASSTTSFTFSSATGALYPVSVPVWTAFEADQVTPLTGTVDEAGPWRNGQPSPDGNTNWLLDSVELTRDDFNIPHTEDYIINWIGIGSTSSNQVLAWIDANTVEPAVTYDGEESLDVTYPDNAVVETFDDDASEYVFSEFNVYAKLKPGVNEGWIPKVHSGWMFDSGQQYYLYAEEGTQTTVEDELIISELNRLGAPLIVYGLTDSTPEYLRQTAYFELDDNATPATPNFSLEHKEIKPGNGYSSLFMAYDDIYDISVVDLNTGATISVTSSTSATNEVALSSVTDEDHTYEVSYRVNKSFYVDNGYDNHGTPSMRIVFDDDPNDLGYDNYVVKYEKSIYDPATPIQVPLNPMFTSIGEGFIYVDHDVHNVDQIAISVSPGQIVADGTDYAMVTVRTLDDNGNPKPYQDVDLYTNFGTLTDSTVTTDVNGFAFTTLTSEEWDGSLSPSPATPALTAPSASNGFNGLVLGVVDTLDEIVNFSIEVPPPAAYKLVGVVESECILADGTSATAIFGKVEDGDHNAIVGAKVYWRKGRDLYQVLSSIPKAESTATPGSDVVSGYVVSGTDGRFKIEPFISSLEPGYWLVSLESQSNTVEAVATPFDAVGDIVFWYEYPNVTLGVDPTTNLPVANNQDATPHWEIPNYTFGSAFPVNYDEEDREAGYSSATPEWEPPKWYAIDRYRQYQMGLYGEEYYESGATPSHPEYREF